MGRRRAMPLSPEIGENQIILERILARRDQNGEFPVQRLFGNLLKSRAKTKTGILGRLATATGETQEPPKVIAVEENRYKYENNYVISV